MKTTIYWTRQHIRNAAHEIRFRAHCWWLNQQVDFLKWRLGVESVMTSLEGASETRGRQTHAIPL